MKLIDKDSLMEIMNCNKPLADGYHMKDYVFEQILHDIDNEPIIEAIPISWLEKCNFTLKLQNTTLPINFIIANLIDIWRTENE